MDKLPSTTNLVYANGNCVNLRMKNDNTMVSMGIPSKPRGRFVHCLQDPKTSSPSKCDILDVKDEAYFAIATTICNGSLKPVLTLCK